nr:phosphotransferase [Zongyanglinia huanghaiensis]
MVNLCNYDETLISKFIHEFKESLHSSPELGYSCIYRSSTFPKSRQVFGTTTEDGRTFAIKIDTENDNGRLEKEFGVLKELFPYFQEKEQTQVIKPIYLSPGGQFHVTEFVDHKTAMQVIYSSKVHTQAGQAYRRAGQWLHELHSFKHARRDRFWFDWMFEEIDAILCTAIPQASASEYRPYLEQMHRDAIQLGNCEDTVVFSHGDFHCDNLILGRGVTYGLDFTEVSEKLAVYDIVDFLKADVFRVGTADEIDRSGILTHNKDMFFRKYRHPVNHDILDFCIRGRLLIDWLKVSKDHYARSSFLRKKFACLGDRLSLAFCSSI